jgi:ribosome biogenesis GTPase
LQGIAPEELDNLFPEMRPVRDLCRFADCAHLQEPGCAVRAAVAAGAIGRERYESYVSLRQGPAPDN